MNAPVLRSAPTTALLLLLLAAACSTPTALRLERKLGHVAQTVRGAIDPRKLTLGVVRDLEDGTRMARDIVGEDVVRVDGLVRPELLPPLGGQPSTVADRALELVGDAIGRAATLGNHLYFDSLPRSPDVAVRKFDLAMRNATTYLGLERQILPDRTDWERRTNPTDTTPPAGWGPRLLRRIGL